MRTPIAATLVFLSLIGSAQAGSFGTFGAVKALTDINQVSGIVGTASFDEGPTSGPIPLNQYSAQGLTWALGTLVSILPGVTTPGSATNPPVYSTPFSFPEPITFPLPIGGGGTQVGQLLGHPGGVGTFSANNITQVGLTAGTNALLFLTVWDKSGGMIGQVTWAPDSDASFVGIDTLGVPIGMVTYGNDNLWVGDPYFPEVGSSVYSDSWVWATGACTTNAQCDDQNVCTTDTCTVATGTCVHVNNTASCTDGNTCTQNDVCSAGACVPGAPVMCAALDTCHTAGLCDTVTGTCSNPAKADGSSCDDGICIAGICSNEAGTTSSGSSGTTTGSASASTGVGGAGAGGASTGVGGGGMGGASTGVGGAGMGGGTGVGGSSATGISGPSATSTTSGGDGTITPGDCGCSTPGTSPARAPWLLLGLLLPALRRRRRASRLAES